MGLIFTLPTRQYQSGTTSIPPQPIDPAYFKYVIAIDITQMLDPATSYKMDFEISYDGGGTWGYLIGTTYFGQPTHIFPKTGTPFTTQETSCGFDQVGNPNRQIRATFEIVGPITIGGTVVGS